MQSKEEQYWSDRYKQGNTGWDIGYPSTPIKTYIDQLSSKSTSILIPGAGNSYEAEYLHNQGFENVAVLDIASEPLKSLSARVPTFPTHNLVKGDFFKHEEKYDLIIEQTFFCSLLPSIENRFKYALKMSQLLREGGLLVGLWFKHPLIEDQSKRPFGGTKEEYLRYLTPHFKVISFEDCYNSIPPRAGNELFGIFEKK